jgi:hypothetical protein
MSGGWVSRIDTGRLLRSTRGAIFELTSPASPIPDAHAGLTAIPSQNSLYAVDTQRGIAADTDPHTLARRGEMLLLASELSRRRGHSGRHRHPVGDRHSHR